MRKILGIAAEDGSIVDPSIEPTQEVVVSLDNPKEQTDFAVAQVEEQVKDHLAVDAAIAEGTQVADALNNISTAMSTTLAANPTKGISAGEVKVIDLAVEHFKSTIGLTEPTTLPALENFGSKMSKTEATKLALESIESLSEKVASFTIIQSTNRFSNYIDAFKVLADTRNKIREELNALAVKADYFYNSDRYNSSADYSALEPSIYSKYVFNSKASAGSDKMPAQAVVSGLTELKGVSFNSTLEKVETLKALIEEFSGNISNGKDPFKADIIKLYDLFTNLLGATSDEQAKGAEEVVSSSDDYAVDVCGDDEDVIENATTEKKYNYPISDLSIKYRCTDISVVSEDVLFNQYRYVFNSTSVTSSNLKVEQDKRILSVLSKNDVTTLLNEAKGLLSNDSVVMDKITDVIELFLNYSVKIEKVEAELQYGKRTKENPDWSKESYEPSRYTRSAEGLVQAILGYFKEIAFNETKILNSLSTYIMHSMDASSRQVATTDETSQNQTPTEGNEELGDGGETNEENDSGKTPEEDPQDPPSDEPNDEVTPKDTPSEGDKETT